MAPDMGNPGNPFQSLLGDLMNMLGSSGPDQWETTRSFGLNVATGGAVEPNADPVQRIKLEELARVAELHVIEATGMPVSYDGRRVTCVSVGLGEWTGRALDAWKAALVAMAPPPVQVGNETEAPLVAGQTGGLGDLIGRWTAAIGPLLFGLQVGSVVGHLSHRALGQYVLALPWSPSDELLIVTANVAAFAEDWSIPEEEALLWVTSRELASHAVLSRPAVRARMEELLGAVAESAAATQTSLVERLGALGDASDPNGVDLESLQGMFGDPEALLGGLLTPESRRPSSQLTAIAVVVDAYADHIADTVGKALVGSHSQLAEAWYRRRIERGKGEEAAGALFGLDLDQTQVDRGRAFIAGVVERAGGQALGRLWTSSQNLPTPPEVDAPGLWLERISLPELEQPDFPTEP